MKAILFAAALSISGVAMAQNQATSDDSAQQSSGQTVDDPSEATGPAGVTQQGTDPDGQAMAPAGSNEMAMPAPGQQTMPMTGMGGPFEPRAATGDYPPCSKTVTDNCTQTYERGVRRAPRRR